MSNQLAAAIAEITEAYRGTEHGKVAESIGDAIHQALAAHEAAKPASILTQDEIDGLYAMHGGDGGPTAICEQFAPALIRAVMAAESDDLEIHSSDANLIGKHTALWVNYMALKDELEKLREQLAAHEAAKPAEPFGYVSEHNCEGPHQFQFHNSLSSIYWDNCKNFTAVYAAPVAVASLLTVEQIKTIWDKHPDLSDPGHVLLGFARAIEVAHGIKEQA